MEPVLDDPAALWSGVVLLEPVLGCALVDPAALCELASGAVPGVLVAGWLPLALWSLCGMLLAEEVEVLPLVLEALWSGVVLLDGVVLLEAAALWSVDDGALGELDEAEGDALPAPLSHLSEIICTLSTLMVSWPDDAPALPVLEGVLDSLPLAGLPCTDTMWPTCGFRS